MTPSRVFQAGLPLLLLVMGAASIRPNPARADGGARRVAAHPGRSTQAPAEVVALSDYLLPAPRGGPPGGGGEDVPDSGVGREPNIPTQSNPNINKVPGGGTVPDTAKTSLFHPAVLDTSRGAMGQHNTMDTAPPPPGARRGILGLHPLAILVGLIALDIFVVSAVGK